MEDERLERRETDMPAHPDRGVIYDGDYFRGIPFLSYLHKENFATWCENKKIPSERIFDVRDFGARGNGRELDTEPIQKALDQAGRMEEENGGEAVVLIQDGIYTAGSLIVHAGTALFIDADAVLAASRNAAGMNENAFLAFKKADHCMLTGGGKILCNGEYYVHLPLHRPRLSPFPYTRVPEILYDKMGYPVDTIRYAYRSRIRYASDPYGTGEEETKRPAYSVWFYDCHDVTIENIVIEDALDWSLVLDHCRDVSVTDTIINDNRHVANTDGIDIMNSRDVTIQHCFISSADDGICIKSPRVSSGEGEAAARRIQQARNEVKEGERGTAVHNIRVQDCTVTTVMNGIKIGTETWADISGISVENCRLFLSDIFPGMTTGISIESCDGARVRNVTMKNIRMKQVVSPLYIGLNRRNKFGFLNPEDEEKRNAGGEISDVTLEGIDCVDAQLPSILTGYAETTGNGMRSGRLKNIHLHGFHVTYMDDEERVHVLNPVRENIEDYPESNAIGDVPACGLYIRHADNIDLSDMEVRPRSQNTRPVLSSEDVENLTMH